MEVSAKDSIKVTDAFMYLISDIKSRMTPIPNVNTNRLFSWIPNMFASCIPKSHEMS